MKTLANLDNGALVVTEQGGVFTLSFNEALSVGGGAAAGIVSIKGQGSIVISGLLAEKLAALELNKLLPAALVPAAEAVEGIAEAATSNA